MKSLKIFLGATLAVLLTNLFLTACGDSTSTAPVNPTVLSPTQAVVTTGGYLDTIKQRGRLLVGTQYDVPGFGYKNPTTGLVEGFDVDLAHQLAATLLGDPNKLDLVETIGGNRIPFLQEDKIDLVISTMTINDERKKLIDFSDVYYVAGQSILVRKGSSIKNVGDLNGKQVCTTQASTSEKNVRQQAPSVSLKLFAGFTECLVALDNEQVDALTTDDIILFSFKLQAPDKYELVGGQFTKEPYGIGIKQGRPELLAFVNASLNNIKADGRWKASYNKWVKPATGQSADPPR